MIAEPKGDRCQSPGPDSVRLGDADIVGILHSSLSHPPRSSQDTFILVRSWASEFRICYGNKHPQISVGFISFSHYTCPLCVNWGLCFMLLSLQHLTDEADTTCNVANSIPRRKKRHDKLFIGSFNVCLEVVHVISAHISLVKVNHVAMHNYKDHTLHSPTMSESWKHRVESTMDHDLCP